MYMFSPSTDVYCDWGTNEQMPKILKFRVQLKNEYLLSILSLTYFMIYFNVINHPCINAHPLFSKNNV